MALGDESIILCNVTLVGHTLSFNAIYSLWGGGGNCMAVELGEVHFYYIDVTLIDQWQKMYCCNLCTCFAELNLLRNVWLVKESIRQNQYRLLSTCIWGVGGGRTQKNLCWPCYGSSPLSLQKRNRRGADHLDHALDKRRMEVIIYDKCACTVETHCVGVCIIIA